MKTCSIDYAKAASDKVSVNLMQIQQIKILLASVRDEICNAMAADDRDARERARDEESELLKEFFRLLGESTATIKELSETEIIHGEKPL